MSLVFNIADLYPYQGTWESQVLSSYVFTGQVSWLLLRALITTFSHQHIVDDGLNDEVIASQIKGFRRFLVPLKGPRLSDATWIMKEEFRQLDARLLDAYLDHTS